MTVDIYRTLVNPNKTSPRHHTHSKLELDFKSRAFKNASEVCHLLLKAVDNSVDTPWKSRSQTTINTTYISPMSTLIA